MALLTQTHAEVAAIAVRQPDIEDDGVDARSRRPASLRHGGSKRPKFRKLAVVGELVDQGFAQGAIVIHDQNQALRSHHSRSLCAKFASAASL